MLKFSASGDPVLDSAEADEEREILSIYEYSILASSSD
jgi:hypothetical protein